MAKIDGTAPGAAGADGVAREAVGAPLARQPLPLARVVADLDHNLRLYEDAAALHRLLPPEVRERADVHPDPEVEVRTLLAPLACMSDETRTTITDTLSAARRTVVLAEERIAELEREVAVLADRLDEALGALGVN